MPDITPVYADLDHGGWWIGTDFGLVVGTWDHIADLTIITPVAGEAYSGNILLRANEANANALDWYAFWQYKKGIAGVWTDIGSGATVASGADSTLLWSLTGLLGGSDYYVRAKAFAGGDASSYVEAGPFTIGIGHLPPGMARTAGRAGAAIARQRPGAARW